MNNQNGSLAGPIGGLLAGGLMLLCWGCPQKEPTRKEREEAWQQNFDRFAEEVEREVERRERWDN